MLEHPSIMSPDKNRLITSLKLTIIALAPTMAGCETMIVNTGVPAQPEITREITQIAGDLYRVQNNRHFTVFLVTPEGVILADPINADVAAWLRTEIATRFDLPVKYVIYSHHHGDHASGGEVFADTATFIGHVNMLAQLDPDSEETAEVWPPTETYENRMTVELGGKNVELHYLGRNHSASSTVMLFPDERAVFAVDFVSVRRLPFRDLRDSYLPDWLASLEKLEALDFDILSPGHGAVGTKFDVAEHHLYLEQLVAGVSEGIVAMMMAIDDVLHRQIGARRHSWAHPRYQCSDHYPCVPRSNGLSDPRSDRRDGRRLWHGAFHGIAGRRRHVGQ